jgi:uncharacterized protein
MDWLLAVLGAALMIAGLIGCVLPVLPGPPLNFAGMLLLHFTRFARFGTGTLVVTGLAVAVSLVLDYAVPAWGVKRYGGTKAGTIGSVIGLFAGLIFIPPLGPMGIVTLLGGPFLGAWLGEIAGGTGPGRALRPAFGTFVGFLAGTFLRVALSAAITVMAIVAIVKTV